MLEIVQALQPLKVVMGVNQMEQVTLLQVAVVVPGEVVEMPLVR